MTVKGAKGSARAVSHFSRVDCVILWYDDLRPIVVSIATTVAVAAVSQLNPEEHGKTFGAHPGNVRLLPYGQVYAGSHVEKSL